MLTTDEPGLKLLDFGVSKLRDSDETQTGAMIGTPAYMAPEQRSASDATSASDIYSLGMTLFALVTSGTTVTDPLPATTIECWAAAAAVVAPPARTAPSRSTTPTTARRASDFMRRSYAADRTPRHIRPRRSSWRFNPSL